MLDMFTNQPLLEHKIVIAFVQNSMGDVLKAMHVEAQMNNNYWIVT